eukprot:g4720.t1
MATHDNKMEREYINPIFKNENLRDRAGTLLGDREYLKGPGGIEKILNEMDDIKKVEDIDQTLLVLTLPLEEKNIRLVNSFFPNNAANIQFDAKLFRDALLGIRHQEVDDKNLWGSSYEQNTIVGEKQDKYTDLLKRDESLSIFRSEACFLVDKGFQNFKKLLEIDEKKHMKKQSVFYWKRLFFKMVIYKRFLSLWLGPYINILEDGINGGLAKQDNELKDNIITIIENSERRKKNRSAIYKKLKHSSFENALELRKIYSYRKTTQAGLKKQMGKRLKRSMSKTEILSDNFRLKLKARCLYGSKNNKLFCKLPIDKKEEDIKILCCMGKEMKCFYGKDLKFQEENKWRFTITTQFNNSEINLECSISAIDPEDSKPMKFKINPIKGKERRSVRELNNIFTTFLGTGKDNVTWTLHRLYCLNAVESNENTPTEPPEMKQHWTGKKEKDLQTKTCCNLLNKRTVDKYRHELQKVMDHSFPLLLIILLTFFSLFLGFAEGTLIDSQQNGFWLRPTNLICSILFTFEVIGRMWIMEVKPYFTNGWCLLDFLVTLLDWIAYALAASFPLLGNAVGLRVIRGFRLLRVVNASQKAAKFNNAVKKHLPYLTMDETEAAKRLLAEYNGNLLFNNSVLDSLPKLTVEHLKTTEDFEKTVQENDSIRFVEKQMLINAYKKASNHFNWNLLFAKALKDRLEKTCHFKVFSKISRLEKFGPKVVSLYITASDEQLKAVAEVTEYKMQISNRPILSAHSNAMQLKQLLSKRLKFYSPSRMEPQFLDYFLFQEKKHPELLEALFRWGHTHEVDVKREHVAHAKRLAEQVDNKVKEGSPSLWKQQYSEFWTDEIKNSNIYYAPYMKYTKANDLLFRGYTNDNTNSITKKKTQTSRRTLKEKRSFSVSSASQLVKDIEKGRVAEKRVVLKNIDRIILLLKQFNRHLNFSNIVESVCVDHFIPHNRSKRNSLHNLWSKKQLFNFKDEPALALLNYFGSDVAFYFIWLRQYAKHLRIPAVIGLFLFIVQTAIQYSEEHIAFSQKQADTYCGSLKANKILASNQTVSVTSLGVEDRFLGTNYPPLASAYVACSLVYVAVTAWWTSDFHKKWNAYQARIELLFYGETRDDERSRKSANYEPISNNDYNPNFKGIMRRNPITDKIEKSHNDKLVTKYDRMLSTTIISMLMFSLVIAAAAIIALRIAMNNDDNWKQFAFVPGILNGIVIIIFDMIWKKVAYAMTDFENHLTIKYYADNISDMQESVVRKAKAIVCNIKPEDNNYVNANETDAEEMYTDTSTCKICNKTLEEEYGCKCLHRVTVEIRNAYDEPEYGFDEQFANYNEIVINHGYWLLFAGVYPLGAFLTLILNSVEGYLDALDMTKNDGHGFRRANPTNENEINMWKQLVDSVSLISYGTNSAIIVFTTNAFQGSTVNQKLFYFFILACSCYFLHWLSTLSHSVDHQYAIILGKRFNYLLRKLIGFHQVDTAIHAKELGADNTMTDLEFEAQIPKLKQRKGEVIKNKNIKNRRRMRRQSLNQ